MSCQMDETLGVCDGKRIHRQCWRQAQYFVSLDSETKPYCTEHTVAVLDAGGRIQKVIGSEYLKYTEAVNGENP